VTVWLVVLGAALGCYLIKLAGLSVPSRVLERPLVERVADLLPVALLSGLIAVQVFGSGASLHVDARALGLLAGALALAARAPFLTVVVVAAVTAALIRLL